jgi:hypothetical protein
MKLQPETIRYLRKLTKEERAAFLDYLHDADANIRAEVNHLDNEMNMEDQFVHEEKDESE